MDKDTARQRAFEVLLDPTNDEHLVSLPTLKRLCARGIPEWPVQWRPLSWQLLLGVRGKEKSLWESEEKDRWAAYYRLVDELSSSFVGCEEELLKVDEQVRAYARTEEGKWLRRKVQYPTDHPFGQTQETSDLATVRDRRAVQKYIQSLRNRPSKASGSLGASHPETSPEITLSPSPGDEKPTTKHLRGPRTKPQPRNPKSLSLVVPPTSIVVTAASPTTAEHEITLLPSRPISPHRPTARAEEEPETLADGLIRLLAVSIRQSPAPHTHLFPLARTLYALFVTDGDTSALTSDEEWDPAEHAEAESYACLRALLSDAGVAGLMIDSGRRQAGERLAKRVFWADEGLYRVLTGLHLDLRNDVFVHEWLGHLFVRSVEREQVWPLWDAIFSEDEDATTLSPGTSGKTELLLDICTAMLLLVKDSLRAILDTPSKPGFWHEPEQDRLLFDPELPDLPADQAEEKTARARALLSAFPMREVGVDEVVRVAWEVRQRRVMCLLDGEDLDEVVLPVSANRHAEEDGLVGKLETLAVKATSSVRESMNPLPRYTNTPLVDIGSVKNTLTSSGERIKDYAAALQDSDAAARVSKASSNLTAVALMRLNSLAGQQDVGWTGAASRLWKGKAEPEDPTVGPTPKDADVESVDPPEKDAATDEAINDGPAALFRRDTNLPPSFITPRGSIIYPAGRYRPKAPTTGTKPSLQSRLAAVASSPAAQPAVSPERKTSVKPLLLSRAAKPASPLHVEGKSAPMGRVSPSPSLQNLDVVENYVSRKVSVSRRSQRSSLGYVERDAVEGETTSARLRKATRDSYTAERRYHLSDPGAKSDEQAAASPDARAEAERYQLHDGAVPATTEETTSRRQSVASVEDPSAGVSRSKVVRKGKFASKAAHNRLQSAGHIDVNGMTNGDTADLPVRTSSLSQPATPVAGQSTPESLLVTERPERSSSLQKSAKAGLDPVDRDDDEPVGAKDGYGDLLESYAAALEIL